jgi:hypothetical protein
MSMPILASAVERRPHLFVDVRGSSSVHSVAGLRAVIDYFLAETIRSKVLRLVHKFRTRAPVSTVRASVNRGKDKLESIH